MIFKLILSCSLWAQSIVIPSVDLSDQQLEEHLAANPHQRSYIQFKNSQRNFRSQTLFNYLKKAQLEFLNGSLENSKDLFLKIYNMRFEANWKKKERKTIHYSILRLAQLTRDETKQKTWMAEALRFDYDAEVDTEIFPPPFTKQYQKLKQKKLQQVWNLPTYSDKYDKILINGKTVGTKTSFIRSLPGEHRIQFLSNRFAPVHIVGAIETLKNRELPLQPLASGSCSNPQPHPSLDPSQPFVFAMKGCKGKFLGSPHTSQLEPRSVQPPSLSKKSTSEFYKSKWFWVGVSVLTTGLIIANNQKKSGGQPQSTNGTGFTN